MLILMRKWSYTAGLISAGMIFFSIATAAYGQELPKGVEASLSSGTSLVPPKSMPASRISPRKLQLILGSGDAGYLEKLLAEGVDPNLVISPSGRTLLMAAQSVPIIRLLLMHGADPNIRDEKGATALHHTVMCPEAFDIIPLLLEKGADINAVDNMGHTALMSAVANDKPELVRLMLERGADPGIRNHEGQSALDWAQDLGIADIVDMLEAADVQR